MDIYIFVKTKTKNMDINQKIKDSIAAKEAALTPTQTPVETPKVETPKAETPKEEPKVETTKVEPKVETSAEKPEYLKKWTELSGGKYVAEKDEDIKTFFEKVDKHSELEKELEARKAQDDYYKELEATIETNYKEFDPVARYGSRENYAKIETVKSLAKQGNEIIAAKLVGADLDKVNDLEVVSLYNQFIAPNLVGKELRAKQVALDEIGADTENVDWNNLQLTELQEGKLAIKAANIRNTIKTMVSEAEKNIPELTHPLQKIKDKVESRPKIEAERKEKWVSEYSQSIEKGLDKIEFKEYEYEYTIDEADRKELVERFVSEASRKGWEPNEANKQKVIEAAKRYVRDRDFEKLVPSLLKAREAKLREEFQKEHNNLQPLNTDKPANVPPDEKATFQSAVRKQFNLK